MDNNKLELIQARITGAQDNIFEALASLKPVNKFNIEHHNKQVDVVQDLGKASQLLTTSLVTIKEIME